MGGGAHREKEKDDVQRKEKEGNTGERDTPCGDWKVRHPLLLLHLAPGLLSESLGLSVVGVVQKLSLASSHWQTLPHSKIQSFLSSLPEHPSIRMTSFR